LFAANVGTQRILVILLLVYCTIAAANGLRS